jgi:hypothetical protein
MNLKCTVIEDLLPLYIDGICSEDTKEIVEKHLAECPACMQKHKSMSEAVLPEELCSEGNKKESDKESQKAVLKENTINSFTAKKAFKKIRKRFIALILLILFTIPNIYLCINQADGDGVSYTNLDDIYKANRILSEIKKGNYEKAFSHLDIQGRYQEITENKETPILKDFYSIATVNHISYYVTDQVLWNEYSFYETDHDEKSFWYSIFLSNNYVIPEEQYNHLLEEYTYEEMYTEIDNRPVLISSDYGSYYVPYRFLPAANSEDNDTALLSSLARLRQADIIPSMAYEAALKQEAEYIEDHNAYIQKYIDMGYEEYYTRCKDHFLTNMEQLIKRGVVISGFKLDNIYFIKGDDNNRYQIEYTLDLNLNGTSEKGIGLIIFASDGKLEFSGGFTKTDTSQELAEKYQITSAFSLSININEYSR